jgi:hypothetical protein
MNSLDVVILVAYLLCLSYFLNKIKDSFNDEYTIRLNEEALNQQLTDRDLQDFIAIKFNFDKRYEYVQLKQLSINISNKSDDHSIYVDWDCCALNDLEKRSRRVARLMPGTTLDLFQEQVFSTIAPNTTLKENITAEDLLKRKGDLAEFEASQSLINFTPAKPGDDLKKRLGKFNKQELNLEFAMEVAFRLVGPRRGNIIDRHHILCTFVIEKLPWTAGLPWNPRK